MRTFPQLLTTVLCVTIASLALPAAATPGQSRSRQPPARFSVADGVYVFASADYGDVGLDGNSVVVVSTDGVLVFDTNGTPAAAEAVLAEIRKLTSQPVRYVVNSHWHWDHWYGTEVYQRAFPGVRIIAHERTRAMMLGPAIAFNKPGLESQLPEYIRSVEQRVAAARAGTAGAAPPEELQRLERLLAEDRFFLEQKRAVRHVIPNVTFTDRLTLHLGDREIQVWHVDRAVTPGDAFLYLPVEKVLVTGDLLVNPISFALSCYPSGWLRTLERLEAFDAATIVPGHGEPLRDRQLLRDTMDVFRVLLREGAAAKRRGIDADEARETILPALDGPMQRMTKGDQSRVRAFRVQLVDWFLHRVYDELDGPLTDTIAPIPIR